VITIVDEREERIAEKHGSTGRFIYKEAVKRFLEGEIELEEMMDRVMEFGEEIVKEAKKDNAASIRRWFR